MTAEDRETFDAAFKRLALSFRLRLRPTEAEELAQTYFRALEEHPLDRVLQAAKAMLGSHRSMPKIADWLAQLRPGAHGSRVPSGVRVMVESEVAELARAERLGYQDEPCGCWECRRAGVDHRPIRFVPTLIGDEEERALHPRRDRVECLGHWAHGEELVRWYDAKARFEERAGRGGVSRAVAQLLNDPTPTGA